MRQDGSISAVLIGQSPCSSSTPYRPTNTTEAQPAPSLYIQRTIHTYVHTTHNTHFHTHNNWKLSRYGIASNRHRLVLSGQRLCMYHRKVVLSICLKQNDHVWSVPKHELLQWVYEKKTYPQIFLTLCALYTIQLIVSVTFQTPYGLEHDSNVFVFANNMMLHCVF